MAPVLQLLLLCSLSLLLHLLPAGAQSTTIQELYVKPTEDTSCPEPCHTLDEYVQNATQYFVSNTAFNFLHGTHNLSQPLKVSGVTNLALMASNGTVNITCPYNSYLSFAEISNLTLEDLTLSMCGILFISDVLNCSLFRVCLQPFVNLPHEDLMLATNLLGTSMIVGFSVISADTAHHGFATHDIWFLYTNPSNWTPSPLPFHNHLLIRDSILISECDILVDCYQSTYAVSIHVENLTATHPLFLSFWGPNNVSLVNSVINQVSVSLLFAHVGDTVISNVTFSDLQLQVDINQVCVSLIFAYVGDTVISNVTFSDLSLQLQPVDHYNKGQSTSSSLVQLYYADDVSFAGCNFIKNEATFDRMWGSVVLLDHSNNISFTNCEFSGNVGSPITALESTFTLSGSNNFSNNRAYQGGALGFYGNSYVTLSNWSNTQFHNNSAVTVGGAIYVDYELNPTCFFHLYGEQIHCYPPYNQTPAIISANLSFINNIAENGGDTVYGASFDTCKLTIGGSVCDGWELIRILFPPNNASNLSLITSDSLRACLCEDGRLSCATVFKNLSHYPGESFQVSAVVVGDRFGTVYGSVYAQLLPLQSSREVASLGYLERSQRVEHLNCTNLTYTIFSNTNAVTLVLTADSAAIQQYPSDDEITEIKREISQYTYTREISYLLRAFPIYINITLLPCPLGFMLSDEPPRCTCDTLLQDNHISCNLTTQTVQRSGTVWVNASFHNYSSNGVILNKYCPNNYCKPETVNVNLEHPDTQCAFSHSGILCGGCQSGLSLALGSAQCLPCSNDYLALLIPFALAGFALVFFIKLLNLTVAYGTLNGLIFYANIVRANQGAWIPADDTNILTVFIAWLNLDLGIETCFFDGLDAYSKTWLQFVFPLYIWAIVVLIIILSHYFSTAAKIFGSNSVPVLATLFLLSYPKLLRTVISILQASTLYHPDGTTAHVWSYDGNISYRSPIHVPLVLVALAVLLLLSLPYTGVLLFAQCLQKVSNYRVVRLLTKLKPFFDAYFGPLKDKHRYWVGLLLLVRGALFIVYATTPTSMATINLLATVATVLSFVVYPYVGWVYKQTYLNLLENSFFLNLGLLAAGTLYIRTSGGSQAALVYTSVGIAFVQFTVIVLFHAFTSLTGTRWYKGIACGEKQAQPDQQEYEHVPEANRQGVRELRVSFNVYREPVLKYLDS